MNKNEHSIGKAIAKLRAEKGWTQARLAKELCVEDKTISRWECEEGYPSISSLPQIAKVFNVSIDYLLTGNEPEQLVSYISKKESCAKNDDLELFESIDKDSLTTKDENGKTMLDYILIYFPQKVMKAYADKIYSTDMRLKFLLGTVDLPWNPSEKGKIGNYDNLFNYKGLNVWGDYRSSSRISESVYNEKLFDFLIAAFEQVNKESLNLYLCQFPSVAEKLFAKAIDLLPSEKGENIIKYLFSFRDEYNSKKYYIKTDELWYARNDGKKYFSIGFSTFAEDLLDKGFIELAQNCDKNLDSSKIELAKLKKQGKDNTKEAELLKCERDGVLDGKKLLEANDYELAKLAFKKHPNIIDRKACRFENASKAKECKVIYLPDPNRYFSYSNAMLYEPRSNYMYFNGRGTYTSCFYIHSTYNESDRALEALNKCLKNNILAVVYARTKRNEFSKDYKMSYICDFYNRHLYEECINASYNKLKEFFEIACHLTGSMEEMLDKYYVDFEPGCIYKTYNDGENIHIVSERLIKDVMQEIITAYNMLQVDSYNPKVLSEDCLNLLGKIFNEPVYIDRPDDDWEY